MGNKGDISYSEPGLSISETDDLLCFQIQPSLGFTENGVGKISSERQVCRQNVLLIPEVTPIQDNRKANLSQISSDYNRGTQKGISEDNTNLEVDGLQQRKTTLCANPASKEQLELLRLKMNNRILENLFLV